MKKLLLVLGVLMIFAVSGMAQTEGIGITAKGIKAGINLANIYGDDVDESDMLLGFGGGVFMEYSFTPQFAVQPEVLFMMKGATTTEVEDEESIDIDWKFNYIEIPVLLKFKPAMEGNFKPNVFAGPAVGLLLSADAEPDGGESEDVKDFFKSMDFGITFGAGFMYMMQNGSGITFDIRYTLGMMKIGDGEEMYAAEMSDTNEDPDLKTNNISFMVGYSF